MSKKFNNEYKVPNEKADEIRNLNNKELVNKASVDYQNWQAAIRQKKAGGEAPAEIL